jgi:hypothetical protein
MNRDRKREDDEYSSLLGITPRRDRTSERTTARDRDRDKHLRKTHSVDVNTRSNNEVNRKAELSKSTEVKRSESKSAEVKRSESKSTEAKRSESKSAEVRKSSGDKKRDSDKHSESGSRHGGDKKRGSDKRSESVSGHRHNVEKSVKRSDGTKKSEDDRMSVQSDTRYNKHVSSSSRSAVGNKPTKVFTKEEQTIMDALKGYYKVPKDTWNTLPPNTHVRYFRKNPTGGPVEYRKGGFIMRCFTSKAGEDCMSLKAGGGFGGKCPSWVVKVKDIDSIWKKYDVSAKVEFNKMEMIIERINTRLSRLEQAVTGIQHLLRENGY